MSVCRLITELAEALRPGYAEKPQQLRFSKGPSASGVDAKVLLVVVEVPSVIIMRRSEQSPIVLALADTSKPDYLDQGKCIWIGEAGLGRAGCAARRRVF